MIFFHFLFLPIITFPLRFLIKKTFLLPKDDVMSLHTSLNFINTFLYTLLVPRNSLVVLGNWHLRGDDDGSITYIVVVVGNFQYCNSNSEGKFT